MKFVSFDVMFLSVDSFFQQKIQVKMVQICSKKNLPQHINELLDKKIDFMLYRAREFSKSKNNSVHSLSQKTIPTNHFLQTKHNNTDAKPSRRVCFRPIFIEKHQDAKQKLKFLLNDTQKQNNLKKSFKKNGLSIKTIKSLDTSFAWTGNEVEQNITGVSLRLNNPQFKACKILVDEILKKLQTFEDSNFLEEQLAMWIDSYAQKQKLILGKIFLKRLQLNTSKRPQIQVQRNKQNLYSKVSAKQKDSFRNVQRFVKSTQLSQFDKYLESLYVEKTRIKMKQIEQNLMSKMTFVCKQIRQQQNNDYHCSLRKKPSDIAHFMTDLKAFQSQLGELKRVSKINRSRFKLLNETDLQVEAHAFRLNDVLIEPKQSKKMDLSEN